MAVMLFFLPGLFFIFISHLCSFMVVWGLCFWGWGFQLMGVGAWWGFLVFVGFGLSILT